MEFHIQLAGQPDLRPIEAAIVDVDPAAVVDFDAPGRILRIATSLDAPAVLWLVNAAGCDAQADRLTQLPSICCGGCSG